MRSQLLVLVLLLALPAARSAAAPARSLLLVVRRAPAHGLVLARADFGRALAGVRRVAPVLEATAPDGRPVPVQFVPDPGGPATRGTVVLRLPKGGDWKLSLRMAAGAAGGPRGETTVATGSYMLRFDPARMAGFPSAITFDGTGRVFDAFTWNDRVHDPTLGSFLLRNDPEATVQAVSDGPVCHVVRVSARYCQEGGAQPPSRPAAVYDWYLFRGTPLAFVSAAVTQREPFAWSELHLLELDFPGADFTRWAGGEPKQEGDFTAAQKGMDFGDWAAVVGGRDAIGTFGTPAKIYDGRGGYGTYLHSTWTSWGDRATRMGAWLWLGSADDPANAVRQAAREYRAAGQAVVTTPALQRQIAALRARAARLPAARRPEARWRAAIAENLEAEGRLEDAAQVAGGRAAPGLSLHVAGGLGLALERAGGGIRPRSLHDLVTGTELLAPDQPPLFSVSLREAGSSREAQVTSSAGWRTTRVRALPGAVEMLWAAPTDGRLKGLAVTARAAADAAHSAWRWTLRAANPGSTWSVERVSFPQVAVAQPGTTADVVVPRGPGEAHGDVWTRRYEFRGTYPSGWCAMPLLAAYGTGAHPTGLYFAIHDPWGSTKDVRLETDPAAHSARMAYDHPAANMGRAGNGFTLGGEAVWQVLRGDWFDAATIYRAWARREAKWWPKLGPDGRPDTPRWMRELSAWALGGGAPAECVEPVKAFARFLGVPVGFHWYNWHVIPFDNDYPHYFPTKPGVAEGVRELQQANVRVMPYINGRLWDTRDRGAEDWEFTRVALPSATKQPDGKPYVESYGSKESDGSPVRLAAMCPTTELWQRTVRETVLRLMNEVGVSGVYIDQIAAAAPALCMDASHGHPLGGGHWWTRGYWDLLGKVRSAMPAEHMLTTECNGEPYIHRMDGYLTWHWQYDGAVPLFPAVYGGAIQMFGRSYGGGPTRDLALRMRAGQQLVFGEQIGWIAPEVIKEPANAGFFRHVVRMRHRFSRYFYAGEMARPPKLAGTVPTVRADWQWGGEMWVTTPAVLTGAWRLPAERRLLLLFVNVGDSPVTARPRFDPRAYGVASRAPRLRRIDDPDGPEQAGALTGPVTFAPHRAVAWEVRW